MPTVNFRGTEIECREGATLRDVLLNAGVTPHNGKSATFNCRGFASCGTCAVKVSGEVSEPGLREKARLLTPPHHPNYNLRLACQTKVLGDVTVEKYPGTWGTQLAEGPLPPIEADEIPEPVSEETVDSDDDPEPVSEETVDSDDDPERTQTTEPNADR